MKCLILASGFATRLYPLTLTRAKPLLTYKYRPLLSHIVDKIPQKMEVYITVNKKFENDFRIWQEDFPKLTELVVEDVWREEQSLGATGSLLQAVQDLSFEDDLLVLAGDNYFEFSIPRFLGAYNGKNTLIAVHDTGNRDDATQFGVVTVEGSKVTSFEEKPSQPKSSLIATGCYVFPARIFPLLEKYCASDGRDNLGDFIEYLFNEDEVHAWSFQETWFDMGNEFDPSA
ncbi:MAG: nucleotidyltransferase family protein [Dehalococcoidales bacterium]|jgi:glucose-1-phosphate thymidylyltransferase|nr:nucleotidyltransferase family protein [Dehalococcoidales bacterium]